MRIDAALWTARAAAGAVLAGAAVVGAHWFWKFAAPSPSVIGSAVAPAARPLESIVAAGIFGTAPTVHATAATLGASELHLRGISSTRRGGMAVIAVDKGRTVTAAVGEEIVPGVKLDKVHPDHVIVTRAGIPQRLELPQRRSTDQPPIKAAANPAQKR